jgi:hypothetical protein
MVEENFFNGLQPQMKRKFVADELLRVALCSIQSLFGGTNREELKNMFACRLQSTNVVLLL